MKKTAVLTIIGLISGAAGIFIGYLFLKSLNNGANLIFLISSILFFATSIVSLYLATNPKKSQISPIVDSEIVNTKTANMIEKNNSVMTEWNKTIETHDKLKMLKIAGSEDEKQASM